MKLKEYIKHLEKIEEKCPNLLVVYAADGEGNNFSTVEFTPTLGHYLDSEFDQEADPEGINAICIN